MKPDSAAEPPKPATRGRYPPQSFYIVGTEAAERFSYYGMVSILTLYVKNVMGGGETEAKETVHLFTMAVYFLPLLGGWLADRWWGRYWSILGISLFYCLGHGTLALFGRTVPGLYAGLALIAIGAGGIKPNVAAFLGDQFKGEQGRWLTKVYGWFYWAVNLGALFGFALIPALRDRHGYGWAFGIPGIFMGIATLVFWLGTKHYVRVPTASETSSPDFFAIIWFLLTARTRLTVAEVDGVKRVFRILLVFATIPVFWALYNQVNTSWVIQAEKMVPLQLPGYKIDAERMQSAGALLVLIWVPVMTLWLYPLAERLGLRPTPLRRMGLGMLLAAASFVVCGLIQKSMDGGHSVSIAWQLVPYTILEAGEVLLSATALEFAFSEAGPAMKSTIMSFWYLTNSLGNFLVATFTALNKKFVGAGGAAEFNFYAVLMFAVTILFIFCALRYQHRTQTGPQAA